MDVAAAGFAASQIASAQRGQQAAMAGIRGQQKQDQSVVNLLTQAIGVAKQAAGAAPSAPESAPAPSMDRPSNGLPAGRGSLIDILA
jgi:hypothetical protein